jgi:hypothetical protein
MPILSDASLFRHLLKQASIYAAAATLFFIYEHRSRAGLLRHADARYAITSFRRHDFAPIPHAFGDRADNRPMIFDDTPIADLQFRFQNTSRRGRYARQTLIAHLS